MKRIIFAVLTLAVVGLTGCRSISTAAGRAINYVIPINHPQYTKDHKAVNKYIAQKKAAVRKLLCLESKGGDK